MTKKGSSDGEQGPVGPRGGTTTHTREMARKNLWMPLTLSEALRARAFKERRSETSIICSAVAQYLGVELGDKGHGD